ncbi:MAG TPA: TIGR03435 family protein [Terracidiphilus sp.]|nr:TIGR03435 family protein [Terracidiphilus sp.]
MFERIFAGLFRLYPARFREVYGEEARRLLRERFRDETGVWRRLRLSLDLIQDIAVGLPHAYWTTPKTSAAIPVRPHVEGSPSFHLLAEEKTHIGSFLVGGALSLTALVLFSFLLDHEPPFRMLAGSKGRMSPIAAVIQRLNQPHAASPAETGTTGAQEMGSSQGLARLSSARPMPVADTQINRMAGIRYQRQVAVNGGNIAEHDKQGSNSNPPPGPVKPGKAGAVAALSASGVRQPAPDHVESGNLTAGQNASGGHLEFEVASIRPGKPDASMLPSFALDPGDHYRPADPHGLFTADFSLPVYIMFAYNLSPDQARSTFAKLPKWVTDQKFVIHARAPEDTTKDQMRRMMQSLLADRFGLRAHFETQDHSAFALVLKKPGKLGSKLRPHADGPACPASVKRPAHGWAVEASKLANAPHGVFPPICGGAMLIPQPDYTALLGSRNVTMQEIADTLAGVSGLDRPWVDETGLKGKYDFSIDFVRKSNPPQAPGAEAPVEPQGPTLLEALQEQLGLKLKSTKAPVETLVIERIERPTPN